LKVLLSSVISAIGAGVLPLVASSLYKYRFIFSESKSSIIISLKDVLSSLRAIARIFPLICLSIGIDLVKTN
jgi:hypothetical protein